MLWKSPTVQGVFQPIPGLISCTGVTRRWRVLSHAQNAVRCLALSQVVAPHEYSASSCSYVLIPETNFLYNGTDCTVVERVAKSCL